jgi:hypothetical protein
MVCLFFVSTVSPFVALDIIQSFYQSICHFLSKVIVIYYFYILTILIFSTASVVPDQMCSGGIVLLFEFQISMKGTGGTRIHRQPTDPACRQDGSVELSRQAMSDDPWTHPVCICVWVWVYVVCRCEKRSGRTRGDDCEGRVSRLTASPSSTHHSYGMWSPYVTYPSAARSDVHPNEVLRMSWNPCAYPQPPTTAGTHHYPHNSQIPTSHCTTVIKYNGL